MTGRAPNGRTGQNAPRVRVAEHAGFCFGVRRATDCVEEAIAAAEALSADTPRPRIYTLGKLIHNEPYLAGLARRGVETVEEGDLPKLIASAGPERPVRLIVRAHGIPLEVENLLLEGERRCPNFKVSDCTCPFVRKIQQIAARVSPDEQFFLLFGNEGHPEVVGILSHCRASAYVFSHADDLLSPSFEAFFRKNAQKTPAMAAQTTQNLTEWKKAQEILKKLCTNPIIFDTICNVTEERQREAARLAEQSDLMIVIGGKSSSNTAKLFAVCKDHWGSLTRRRGLRP